MVGLRPGGDGSELLLLHAGGVLHAWRAEGVDLVAWELGDVSYWDGGQDGYSLESPPFTTAAQGGLGFS